MHSQAKWLLWRHLLTFSFYIKHIATRWVRRINLNFNCFSGTGCCSHFGGFSWNNITLCRHLFRSRCWEGWYSLFLLVTFPHKCSWSKNSPARPNPSPQSIGVLSSFRSKFNLTCSVKYLLFVKVFSEYCLFSSGLISWKRYLTYAKRDQTAMILNSRKSPLLLFLEVLVPQ